MNLSNGNYNWNINCTSADTTGLSETRNLSVSYTPPQPQIGLAVLYPTGNVNVTQNQFFNVTTQVCCQNADCGDVNVSLDPSSNPPVVHISYYDYSNDDLKYCNNTAGSWSCSTIDSSGDVGRDTSLALDSNNKAHISYYDDFFNFDLKYCNNTAGSWSCSTIDSSGIVAVF